MIQEPPKKPEPTPDPGALSGKDWNEVVDLLKRMTPRGDGKTTEAIVSSQGTRVIATEEPTGDPGGASFADLPPMAKTDGPQVISGDAWNRLIDYLNMIKPLEFPNVADVTTTTTTTTTGTCGFAYWINVTVTGGTYPFDWMGVQWTASGQTRKVCGSGSQVPPTTTSDFIPRQDWTGDNGTGSGILNLAVGGVTYGYYDALVHVAGAGFALRVVAQGYGPTYFTSLTTSGLNAYSPSPAQLWAGRDLSLLFDNMMGSVTLTDGRVISWVEEPAFPWDF